MEQSCSPSCLPEMFQSKMFKTLFSMRPGRPQSVFRGVSFYSLAIAGDFNNPGLSMTASLHWALATRVCSHCPVSAGDSAHGAASLREEGLLQLHGIPQPAQPLRRRGSRPPGRGPLASSPSWWGWEVCLGGKVWFLEGVGAPL